MRKNHHNGLNHDSIPNHWEDGRPTRERGEGIERKKKTLKTYLKIRSHLLLLIEILEDEMASILAAEER